MRGGDRFRDSLRLGGEESSSIFFTFYSNLRLFAFLILVVSRFGCGCFGGFLKLTAHLLEVQFSSGIFGTGDRRFLSIS